MNIIKCDHLNESYMYLVVLLYFGSVCYTRQGGSNSLSLWMKLSSMQLFLLVLFITF